jgi:hypothetical protein
METDRATRNMKRLWPATAILLIALNSLTSIAGCGAGKKEVSPQQKEEMRQKMIKNAERQQREG